MSYGPKIDLTAQLHGLSSFSARGSVLSANNFVSPLATLWGFIKVVHECNIDQVLWAYSCVCVCYVIVVLRVASASGVYLFEH
jgi:hypothetical protein